ncbi:MAG: hypothetical protein QW562_07585 [Thermosphaera sp.]
MSQNTSKSKPKLSKVYVSKETIKYLYMFKAETLKPFGAIIEAAVTAAYEDEQFRRKVIEKLLSK